MVDRAPTVELAAAVIVFLMLRKGGFYRPYDLNGAMALTALALIALRSAYSRRALSPADGLVLISILLFTIWWAVDSHMHGTWSRSRQVAGAAVGFAACFALGRTVTQRQRRVVRDWALGLGALTSVVGLLGLAFRTYPLALAAQGHFRLAGTLTYSNATGALLAMLLVVSLHAAPSRWRDAELVLVVAALLATQSRGACLAAAVAVALTGARVLAALLPIAFGVLVGGLAVAGSASPNTQPLLAVAVAVGVLGAVLLRLPAPTPRVVLLGAVVAVPLAVALVALSPGLRETVANRSGTASVSDRQYEWQAGWRDFVHAPVQGSGPGHPLALSDGRVARFVHNEPLQVAADAGLVGLALMSLAFLGLALSWRRMWFAGGTGALVALFLAGLLDFPWHVPAITMTAGLLAGGLPESDFSDSPADPATDR